MLDTPTAAMTKLRDLRQTLLAKPATLPAIFRTGDRILAARADPAAPLHGFASDLAVLAPDWRDLIAPLPIGASPAEVDAAPLAQPAAVRPGHPDLGARLVPATA